jgi:predicted ATP-grasp superfamily ATP-dependent carboligase
VRIARSARSRRGRILATDAAQRANLAVIRCLAEAGFEVTALGSSRGDPGLWSRMPSLRSVGPDPSQDRDGFLATVEQLVRAERHDIVVAGTDASLLAISSARERFAPYVPLGLPEPELVRRALDKAYVAAEAARVGLPPPRGRLCEGEAEVVDAARELGYPVVIKPQHTVVEVSGRMERRASLLAQSEDHARDAVGQTGPLIVQERVNAPVVSFGGVAARGRLLAFAISRYARTWPPLAGNVTFSRTIEPPAGLADRVEALISTLGWDGLFELELLDYGDGRYGAIDLNPRPYGSLALATAAGIPLPAIWCSRLLGQERIPGSGGEARIGARYRWEDADIRHLWWRSDDRDVRAALVALRPYRRVAHAYWQLRDPAPSLARVVELARAVRTRQLQRHELGTTA